MNKQVELMLRGARYKQLLENQISHVRKKYNLRKVDVEILHYLSAGVGGDTSKEIQKATKLTKGHISQSIFRMQEMGFLEFAPDERDRRCVHPVSYTHLSGVEKNFSGKGFGFAGPESK